MSLTPRQEPSTSPLPGFWRELSRIVYYSREVWALISPHDRRVLSSTLLLMLLAAVSLNAIPVLLGRLIDVMQESRRRGEIASQWAPICAFYLTAIGIVSLTRESFQAARKYLVQKTCTRIEKGLTVGLVSHLLREDLETLSRQQSGVFHGRVTRGVAGFVNLLKLAFMKFFPVMFTVVLVAHRLSTLRSADRILVFDSGRIVEQGCYDDLATRDGLFRELAHTGDRMGIRPA